MSEPTHFKITEKDATVRYDYTELEQTCDITPMVVLVHNNHISSNPVLHQVWRSRVTGNEILVPIQEMIYDVEED